MKFKIFGVCVFLASGVVQATWHEYYNVVETYYEGTGSNHKLVIKFNTDFHSCGWNSAVNIRHSEVGDVAFKTLTSVLLSATLANKKLSVATSGCDGDRAKGLAFRIKP